nr:MAG TPA: hypothetical protein [Caudoviricetes sp.]
MHANACLCRAYARPCLEWHNGVLNINKHGETNYVRF